MVEKIISKHNLVIDNFLCAPVVKDIKTERKIHLIKSLQNSTANGAILEFGVYTGSTINIIAEYFTDKTVFGFDSFEGLPENWVTKKDSQKIKYTKGFFHLQTLPNVKNNVKLIKGYFEETLPQWLQSNNENIKLLHIDCDLYSSTKTIFEYLNNRIVKETVIIFDELYHWEKPKKYSNWENGEWKALKEWIQKYDRKIQILHRNRHMQCAVRVLE